MSTASSSDTLPGNRWSTFTICAIVAAFTILDVSKVNVALPSIQESLGANSSQLQLIVAGYALAFGLTLVPAGRLGDLHSRRVLFLVGLSLYILFSLVCAIAPDTNLLVIGRFLQGMAAGIVMPQILGFMQQLFVGRERGKAFGTYGAVIGVATAFGPTLGGLLIAIGGPVDGWRLIFWMNVPLGLIILPLAFKLVPRWQPKGGKATMDLVGILFLGGTVLGIMLPFVLTSNNPADNSPLRWLWLVLGAVSLVLFIWWEKRYRRHGKLPVLDFALLRHQSYRYGVLVAGAYFAALPALFLVQTVYLQEGLGLDPLHAGMVGIPFAVASAFSSWFAGRIVVRFGRKLVIVGLVIVIIGYTLLLILATSLPPEVAPWAMSGALLIAGIGGGSVISPNQTLTLSQVPVSQGGVAGSFTQVMQRVGTAIGVAAASSTFFASVFVEKGTKEDIDVYHDALRGGVLVSLGFLVAALIFALLDRGTVIPETAAIPTQKPSAPEASAD